MSTTNTTPDTTPIAEAKRGFADLPCLYCGESDCLRIDLDDLTGAEAINCTQCETDYSVADVRAKIDGWLPVMQWILQAPKIG